MTKPTVRDVRKPSPRLRYHSRHLVMPEGTLTMPKQKPSTTPREVDEAIKRTTQARLCQALEQLTLDARTAGLFVTARALTNAKNAAGWEAAGDLIAAGLAARGERPNESRGQGR